MLALWDAFRHRDFRFFYAGQSVSFLGDMVFHVAMSWQVIELGGSALELGIVLSAYMAAQVALLLVGGVVVDRFRRKNLLLLSDAGQGALVIALAVLAFSGALTMPIVVAFSMAFGAAAALAMPAMTAFVPETVPEEDLASANSLYHGTRTIAMVAGPALGGATIALAGTGAAFALDAFTFAVSLALLSFTRGHPPPERAGTTMLAEVRHGFRYVMRVPWLWIAIGLFAIMNVAEAGPRNVALPVLVADDLGLDAAALGLVLSASAVGSLVALLVVGSRPPSRERRGTIAYACLAATGLAFFCLGLARDLWTLGAIMFVKGAAQAPFSIIWETAIGDSVDANLRGRVVSLDMLGSFALLPFAMAGTGALAALMGARATFLAGGLIVVLCGLAGLVLPKARTFRR